MLSDTQKADLRKMVLASEHPKEKVIDILLALQENEGHLSDFSVQEAAELLNVDPVKIEEITTFYNTLYREPVGKYILTICDSVVCWMNGYIKIQEYLCQLLEIEMGQTTSDGMFTLLPGCCHGYCDHSPAILINKKIYGNLTIEKIDQLINQLRSGE
jgi:NADH-quinone oxidoreductase subunit E